MSLATLFSIFYWGRIRQEAEYSHDLQIVHIKRFVNRDGLYEATENEFGNLLRICREVAKEHPHALTIHENVSYHDSLTKVIGSHSFEVGLRLNDSQIMTLVRKYFPSD